MNGKTTLLLAVLLGGLVLGYYGLSKKAPSAPVTIGSPASSEMGLRRKLIEEPLGNVVKVEVSRGSEEWVFEKKPPADGGPAAWRMTKPMEAKVLSQEVDRIAREAGNIQFEVSYKPGDGAITPQDAGLIPPSSTISLTDDAGKSTTIEIGKPASENETYARMAGDDTVVVAQSNLRKLLKARPIDYRDVQIWNFVPEQATHIEICESPAGQGIDCQYLTREGGQWRFDRPFSARATSKVDEMLRSVARLRVTQWHDDDATKLKLFGLDPGALQINVTVEETVPVAKADADEPVADAPPAEDAPPATEKRTRIYKLHVADRGPIGEDTKVFVRSGDENAVATIFKSAADKFKPVMSEWRDMQVIASDVTEATRIEMTVSGESAALVQKDGQWIYESDASPAESHAVTEYLAAIKGLKAVSFVEGADAQDPSGFENLQADIRLTIPGVEGVERITVGGYTDPNNKLLVYVRRNESGPIAKVRASEISALIKPPASLRDRTVFNLSDVEINNLLISRENEFMPGERQAFTLEKNDNTWAMTAPATAPVRTDVVASLVDSISALKAEAIVAPAEHVTAYGLQAPAVTLRMLAQHDPSSSTLSPKPMTLAVTQQDGKVYGARDDSPIYELNKAVFDQLRAEFRSAQAVEFEPKDVESLTLKSGEESNSFVRKGGNWVFESEPDLPIDSARIDKILTEAKAIKPERFAAYSSDQLAPYGLDAPQFELSLTRSNPAESDAQTITLRVSEKTVDYQPPASPALSSDAPKPASPPSTTAYFAALSGRDGVFLLGSDAVKKIFVPLSELEKK